jgi:hypothetical protein
LICDYRGQQTEVRNQGAGRETCVGFAISAAQEWHDRAGELLSPENAIWAAHRSGGDAQREATTVERACEGLTKHAAVIDSAWPYGNPPFPADRPVDALKQANHRDLPRWERISPPSMSALEDALSAGRPVVVTFGLVPRAWFHGHDEIDAEPGAPITGAHAVLAVGLDANDRLIIKNSWGPWWGDGGYGYVTSRYLQTYGVVAHSLGDAPP